MKFTFRKLKIFNIKIDKIKNFFWFLGLRAFWVVLFLIFLELALGEFLFYKYAVLVERNEPKVIDYNFKFRNNTYQKVLEEWQKKNQKFEEYQIEQYSNPFIAIKTKEAKNLTKEANNPINPNSSNPVIK